MIVLDTVLRTKVLVRDSINLNILAFTAVKRSIHQHHHIVVVIVIVDVVVEPDDSDDHGDDGNYIRGVSYLHDHNIVHLDLKVSILLKMLHEQL